MFVKNKESKVSSTIGVYYCKDFAGLREFVIKVSYYNYMCNQCYKKLYVILWYIFIVYFQARNLKEESIVDHFGIDSGKSSLKIIWNPVPKESGIGHIN